jgi:hypothetical protein
MRLTIREHATKAVDYSIRVALISLFVLPVWFLAWLAVGFPPGGDASELGPLANRITQILGISGFVFLSPAYASTKLLEFAHVPSGLVFDLLYFLAGVISVPAVWGVVIYLLVQLYRCVRDRTKRVATR